MSEKFLRLSDVQKQIPLSRSAIYALIQKNAFPKQIRLSHKVAVWRQTDIDSWIATSDRTSGRPFTITRIEGDVAFIPLTMGYEAMIDLVDLERVKSYQWTAHVTKRSDGIVRSVYAYRNDLSHHGKNVRLHRFLLNAPDDLQVDNVNGNGLDCRRANLRLATASENARNRRIGIANTSGFKGVCWHKGIGKWHAQIGVDGGTRSLGYFNKKEEAAAAYAVASSELHGDFGRTA